MIENVKQTVKFLTEKGIGSPEIGIVLGTGLGKLVEEINIKNVFEYTDIPYFPIATVEQHSGRLIYGELKGKNVIAMQGRFHFYEGYNMQEITFPEREMKLIGIKHLLLSNAAGALNLNFNKGSLMLIDDHINFLPDNPLRGSNYDEFGPRFPDMSQPYSKELNTKLEAIAARENIELHKGVYVAVVGPNLETRAEYRFLGTIADAVGMSTVPEVIVANHMKLSCAAISVLTDECDPDNLVETSIQEIIETAGKAELKLIKLFTALINEL